MKSHRENNESCPICGAPIHYIDYQVFMTCEICGRSFMSNSRCENGHFVCDECHSKKSLDILIGKCAAMDSSNPLEIEDALFREKAVHMHGPEHHTIAGAAVLTAYRNAGGNLDLSKALREMISRGRQVPGGTCGFWGCCGAALSCGIALSIIEGITPLSEEPWGAANMLTSRILAELARYGGPRCCKRVSYLAATVTAAFIEERLGVSMSLPENHKCSFHENNNECLGIKCPFFPGV
ncbi:MAG: DUF5714 domain-containing protein [Clostridiales bacterium]|nr:DUF5714 domain-containing protein [Clostridiales bacterium]MDD7035801.1 DUF5714 domain-containing protein [Bacillota bacterium]MDY2920174.1 DUF5714 domain-containing protein [Lentihominibacter sp.]